MAYGWHIDYQYGWNYGWTVGWSYGWAQTWYFGWSAGWSVGWGYGWFNYGSGWDYTYLGLMDGHKPGTTAGEPAGT